MAVLGPFGAAVWVIRTGGEAELSSWHAGRGLHHGERVLTADLEGLFTRAGRSSLSYRVSVSNLQSV